MRIIITLVLVFIIFSQVCIAQKKKDGLINWDEKRTLSWEDFKGRMDRGSPYEAYTFAGLKYEFEQLSNDEFKIRVHVNFESKKSWHNPKTVTDKLLIHEQNHFDIYEIFARLFIKRLGDSDALSGQKFSDEVLRIFQKTFKELQKFQREYDKETNHSKNEEEQKEWTDKIKRMLDENKEYAKRELVFKI